MRNTQVFTEVESFVADLYRGKNFVLKPYFYTVPFPIVAVGAFANSILKINGNADFVLIELRCSFPFDQSPLQITDTATQETFFNVPQPWDNVVSGPNHGGFDGANLGFMKLLAANSNQMCAVQNTTNQEIAASVFVFCGAQVFTY